MFRRFSILWYGPLRDPLMNLQPPISLLVTVFLAGLAGWDDGIVGVGEVGVWGFTSWGEVEEALQGESEGVGGWGEGVGGLGEKGGGRLLTSLVNL